MFKSVEAFAQKLKNEKTLRIIVIIGIVGMALILFSDSLPEGESSSVGTERIDTEQYRAMTEKRLVEILEKIDGVGKVEVMVTISGTEKYVYAEEVRKSVSGGVGSGDTQLSNSYVLVEKSDGKEALVSTVNNPQISGVVVVCEGGGSARTCEVVYETVSTVLGIPAGKIYVTKIS